MPMRNKRNADYINQPGMTNYKNQLNVYVIIIIT